MNFCLNRTQLEHQLPAVCNLVKSHLMALFISCAADSVDQPAQGKMESLSCFLFRFLFPLLRADIFGREPIVLKESQQNKSGLIKRNLRVNFRKRKGRKVLKIIMKKISKLRPRHHSRKSDKFQNNKGSHENSRRAVTCGAVCFVEAFAKSELRAYKQ